MRWQILAVVAWAFFFIAMSFAAVAIFGIKVELLGANISTVERMAIGYMSLGVAPALVVLWRKPGDEVKFEGAYSIFMFSAMFGGTGIIAAWKWLHPWVMADGHINYAPSVFFSVLSALCLGAAILVEWHRQTTKKVIAARELAWQQELANPSGVTISSVR